MTSFMFENNLLGISPYLWIIAMFAAAFALNWRLGSGKKRAA